MKREEVLERANSAICGDRERDYGAPEQNLGRTAKMWSAYKGIEFSGADVAAMMALLKISRLATSPEHIDNWIDLAGFGAIGCEVATAEDDAFKRSDLNLRIDEHGYVEGFGVIPVHTLTLYDALKMEHAELMQAIHRARK